jgi:hypothetical protein
MKFFALLIFFFPFCAIAGEKEIDAFRIVDKYCLQTHADSKTMKTLLGVNDARTLEKDEAMAKFGVPFALWLVATKSSEYGVYTLGYGTCGLFHKNLDFKEMAVIARAKLRVKDQLQENEVMAVSTFDVTMTKKQKKKQTIRTRIIFEIAAIKVGDRKNSMSIDVALEPVYRKLAGPVDPSTICPKDSPGRSACD